MSTAPVRRVAPRENTNGPPIVFEYRYGTVNGRQATIRSAIGKVMNRYDVALRGGRGWRDWKWRDHRTQVTWRLGGGVLAPVGVSWWQGNGPTIPASRDCRQCHRISSRDFRVPRCAGGSGSDDPEQREQQQWKDDLTWKPQLASLSKRVDGVRTEVGSLKSEIERNTNVLAEIEKRLEKLETKPAVEPPPTKTTHYVLVVDRNAKSFAGLQRAADKAKTKHRLKLYDKDNVPFKVDTLPQLYEFTLGGDVVAIHRGLASVETALGKLAQQSLSGD